MTATLSVAAVHERLTTVELAAVAPKFVGAVGAVVSPVPAATGVFMSAWISVCVSALL